MILKLKDLLLLWNKYSPSIAVQMGIPKKSDAKFPLANSPLLHNCKLQAQSFSSLAGFLCWLCHVTTSRRILYALVDMSSSKSNWSEVELAYIQLTPCKLWLKSMFHSPIYSSMCLSTADSMSFLMRCKCLPFQEIPHKLELSMEGEISLGDTQYG